VSRLALQIARTAGAVSRRAGRGGGTSLPGLVLLRLRPRAVEELTSGLTGGSVIVSATNGKTTTARLLVAAVERSGRRVVANTAGANLLRGVASALLAASRDEPGPEVGVFEVDEAALAAVVDQTRPRALVLMNLFRDQLDRYGELEVLADRWADLVDGLSDATIVVANVDDPAVEAIGRRASTTLTFGVDDPSVAREGLTHAADSTTCRSCGAVLDYDLVTIGHLGHWRCPGCGLRRPGPEVALTEVRPHGLDGQDLTVETPQGRVTARIALPGLHNAYNATAAVAGALAMGVPVGEIGPALEATGAAFGRAERLPVDGRDVVLLLAKNPTGANENIRTVLGHEGPVHALVVLNDRTADGRDVSWIWDVDHEPLLDRADRLDVAGDRAYDLGLRFRYGGIDEGRMTVHDDLADAFDAAVAATPEGGTLYVLPTYTAMLELQRLLTERGLTKAFWRDA
jgi:UDP-N-acetylmuramyl tripeptide synthase